MDAFVERTIEILDRTPQTLQTLLANLTDYWALADEGPRTFRPRDVVGHLLHGEEADWMPRLRIILERGPGRTFDPFDRFAHRKWDGEPLAELLRRFEEARRRNLVDLTAFDLGTDELAREGAHPELGRVTARQLLATWAVHDLGHVAQTARVLAKRVGDAVGPWAVHLPVLADRS